MIVSSWTQFMKQYVKRPTCQAPERCWTRALVSSTFLQDYGGLGSALEHVS